MPWQFGRLLGPNAAFRRLSAVPFKMSAMKMKLLAAGALAVALVAPLGAYAQQGQAPAYPRHARAMPSEARLQQHWARRFGNLNLSQDQQQRIQSMIHQYSQAHPEGTAPDREANREFRRQLMSQLSDDQRNQYRQQMRARHQQMMQRRQQMQGQPGQGYPQGQPGQGYPQGQPGQGYPQGPAPYQGAPQGEGPQGPPPDQGQGPPDQAPPSV